MCAAKSPKEAFTLTGKRLTPDKISKSISYAQSTVLYIGKGVCIRFSCALKKKKPTGEES